MTWARLSVPALERFAEVSAREESRQQLAESARIEPLGAGQDVGDVPPLRAGVVLSLLLSAAAVDDGGRVGIDINGDNHLVLDPAKSARRPGGAAPPARRADLAPADLQAGFLAYLADRRVGVALARL